MYYIEEFINGVLMCKTRPDGEWERVSTANLNIKLYESVGEVDKLQRERDELKERLDLVFDAGEWGISHVGSANYRHRCEEAERKLENAMYSDLADLRKGDSND